MTPSTQVVPSSSNTPNVGAITGGTVGGVVVLIAIICVVLLCLRRRHRKGVSHNQSGLDTTTKSELDSHQKTNTHYPTSEGGTMVSSMVSAPAYSPQTSLSRGTDSWNVTQPYHQGSPPIQVGEWTQQGQNLHQQVYYPPPSDPSQSPKHPHEISAELPEVRSPANAELSDVKSPTNAELPDLRSPVPLFADRAS